MDYVPSRYRANFPWQTWAETQAGQQSGNASYGRKGFNGSQSLALPSESKRSSSIPSNSRRPLVSHASTLRPLANSYGSTRNLNAAGSGTTGRTGTSNNNSDEHYMSKIGEILVTLSFLEPPSVMSQLTDHLFIGGYRDAENLALLRRHGIGHVLNCAAYSQYSMSPYGIGSGIVAYEQFAAEDEEHYPILQHADKARAFIDRAKAMGSKCLVHCAMGVNRSGAICAAYIMESQRKPLLDTIKLMKQKRGLVLCNRGFQRQLIHLAREKGLLG